MGVGGLQFTWAEKEAAGEGVMVAVGVGGGEDGGVKRRTGGGGPWRDGEEHSNYSSG